MGEINKTELRETAIRMQGGVLGSVYEAGQIAVKWSKLVHPQAVLSLLDECDKAEAERDAALAELEALRIQVGTLTEWYSNALDVISDVSAAIPGVTYMDPPDGGDVSIPAQIRRMAKDAELYRWVSSGVQEAETLVSVVLCHGGDSRKVAERIAVYMEANQEVRHD